MAKVKRDWELLSEEQRDESVRIIIDFFDNERNEKIGIIAAENLLDHFLQTIGIGLYNKGVNNSIEYLHDRFEDIKIDIESLLKK
jgi:uncharacterized protein (DUF2164 family)